MSNDLISRSALLKSISGIDENVVYCAGDMKKLVIHSDWNRVFKASVTVRFDKGSEDIYKRLVRSGMQWKICGTTARYISPTE